MRTLRMMTLASVLVGLLPAGAGAESLTEALSKAYATNPDLDAARAELRSADESAPQARAGYRPTISANATVGHTSTDGQALGDDRYNSRTAQLEVAQPLYRGGRTLAAMRQADSIIAAQRASLRNTEQTVLLRGVEAYMNVIRDEAVLELNKNNEQVLRRQLQATRDRFSVGEVTRTDVSQAEARLSGAIAAHIQSEGALTESRAAYQNLFGQGPTKLTKPGALEAGLPMSLDEAVELAVDANPQLVLAKNNSEAASAILDGVRGERLPTLTATGRLAHSYDNGSSTYGRSDSATALLTLSVPLYQAGSVSSRIRQARQDVSRYDSAKESAHRTVIEAATQAWAQLETSKASRSSRQSQVEAAKIALDGVKEEANVGSRTVLDTLNAEQELLDARVGLVRAEHDEILAQYQLLAAVGRLTARDLQLPVEYYDEKAYADQVRTQWIGSDVSQ